MTRFFVGVGGLLWAWSALSAQDATARLYGKSYALVIGIDHYPKARTYKDLGYAVRDAQGVAAFLRTQGFIVDTLFDRDATKDNIIASMQGSLARRLRDDDRLFVFFAGHGHTEWLGGKDFGYIVPFDGTDNSATYISMEEIRAQSEKMGNAKHQLFVMVSCYGGLLAARGGGGADASMPGYLTEITRRRARQFITAGGKGQQVVDGGPGGYSYFTYYLLQALQESKADVDGDGYITFLELGAFLEDAASNDYQTPMVGTLPGHEMGQFVFRAPRGAVRAPTPPAAPPPSGNLRGAAAAPDPAPPLAGGVIYDGDFANAPSAAMALPQACVGASVMGGLQLQAASPTGVCVMHAPGAAPTADVRIELRLRRASSVPNVSYGLMFGDANGSYDRYYTLALTDDGRYGISLREGTSLNSGNWTTVAPWQSHRAVLPGTATNEIAVEIRGTNVRYFASGVQLGEFTAPRGASGFVGFYVYRDVSVVFERLRVIQLQNR